MKARFPIALALLMSMVMLLTMLASCGKTPTNPDDSDPSSPAGTTAHNSDDDPGESSSDPESSETDNKDVSKDVNKTSATSAEKTGGKSTTGASKTTGKSTTGASKTTGKESTKTTAPTGSGIDLNGGYLGNVKDCGVVGDGKTDDTEAIQKLLDFWPEDSTLFFPAGTYLVSAPLKVREGTNLIGEPATNGVGGSVIKATRSMDNLICSATTNLTGTIFMNLTLDGGSSSGCKVKNLLNIPGFNSDTIANVKLQNCSGNGVYTDDGNDNPDWMCTVENVACTNVAGYALYIISSDTEFNHISVNGGKGIMDWNYGGNCYNDILVEKANGAGLTIGRTDQKENGHVSILNSTFRNNTYGLQISSSGNYEKRVQVEGCEFSGNSKSDVINANTKCDIFYNCNFRSKYAIAGGGANVVFTDCDFACSSISDSGNMYQWGNNKFGVTNFTEKGCVLDKDIYDYKKVYNAAAMKCSSGNVININSLFETGDYESPSAYTDNAPAIQKAIDSLGSKGGIVYFPRGTYGIGTTVKIPSNVTLIGEGADGTTNFTPCHDIAVMFQIQKGATGVLIANCNARNPGHYDVTDFVKGESVSKCQFERIQVNSNDTGYYENLIHLISSTDCVVNSFMSGFGTGGTVVYYKDCKKCYVQTSYISRGDYGLVIDGGSNNHTFNVHYDWFNKSAVKFTNGANNCSMRGLYCDINQRIATLDYSKVTDANIVISTIVSREHGLPGHVSSSDSGMKRTIPEIYIKNAKNVSVIAFSSDTFYPWADKSMVELTGTNSNITVKGCICGQVFKNDNGTDATETNNLLYW